MSKFKQPMIQCDKCGKTWKLEEHKDHVDGWASFVINGTEDYDYSAGPISYDLCIACTGDMVKIITEAHNDKVLSDLRAKLTSDPAPVVQDNDNGNTVFGFGDV